MGVIARPFLFIAIVISVIVCPAQISTGEDLMEVGLDWQVMLKLGISGVTCLLGAWGVLTSPKARRFLMTLPIGGVFVILALGIPAAFSGYSDAALPSLLINVAYIFMVATCMAYLRISGVLVAVLVGGLLTCIFSWVLYVGFPAYGVFEENLGSVTVKRLSGMSHPNSVGRSAAITLLVLFAVRKVQLLTSPSTIILVGFLALTLAFTVSRTSMASVAIGLAFLHLDKVRSRSGIQLLALGAIGFLSVVFLLIMTGSEGALGEKVVGSVAKTGDASELTSGTGRAEIWAETIRLIKEKPLTGYGIGAAQDLLDEFSQSAHNMVLHAGMISGVGGMLMMLALIIYLIRIGFRGKNRIVAAIAMLLVVSGMLEDTVLETFPGPGTLLFYLCCMYPLYISSNSDDDEETLMQENGAT